MKKLLFFWLICVSALAQKTIDLPYREGNTNTLDMSVYFSGQPVKPGNSLSVVAELRGSDQGRIIASIPLTAVDTSAGLMTGPLPYLQPNIYYLGLYFRYSSGVQFRVGVSRVNIRPAGSLSSTPDATGLNVQISEQKLVPNIYLDATPSSSIAAYYANQARAASDTVVTSVSTIHTYANSAQNSATTATSSAQSALNYKNLAQTSADSALVRATRAEAAKQSIVSSEQNALTYRDSTQHYRNQSLSYRDQAGTSATSAGNASTLAVNAKIAAESARDLTQGYRDQAGTSATSAGNASTSAVNAKIAAEAARDAASASAVSAAQSASAAVAAFKGAWIANTPYKAGDLVTNNGNTYRRKADGTSGTTFDPSNWDITALGGNTPTPRSLSSLTDVPNFLGEVALFNGKNYRAMSASPVVWLPSVSGGFPFTDGSIGNTPSATKLSIQQMRDFVVDLQLSGTTTGVTYSIPALYRNSSGWQIQVFSNTGTPGTQLEVARFQVSTSPENGNAITVHTLSTRNSSGVTGRIAVNWSKIPEGAYFSMFGWSETAINAGYMLHPDVFSTHWGYLAGQDLVAASSNGSTALTTANTANANATAALAAPKSLTALSDAPDRIGQISYLSATGKYYRAVSISPPAWVSGNGFPYTDGSQGRTGALISTMRDFLIDMQITGSDPAKVYSLAVVIRSGTAWSLELYETGTPNPYTLVARFQPASSPENGNNVTIHTLTTQNSSGVTARVAVNWSKLPTGSYYSMWGHTEGAVSGGFKLHPDVFVSHWGYLAQYDLQNTSASPEIVAARGTRTLLTARLDPVLSVRGLPNTPVWGKEKLLRWNSWKRLQDYPFDWAFFGDSYTQGGYYTDYFKDYILADGYTNGGAGWCGFSRWGEITASINGSIKASELSVTYDVTQWTRTTSTGQLGIDGHVASVASGNTITVNSGFAHSSVTILFERHSGGAGFQYQINGGAWTTVSTDNPTQDVSNVVINTSALSAGFTLTIQAQGAGVILFGAIGRKTGNVLTLHKCGISGGQATHFNANSFWGTNVANLNLSGALIMFGTNEQGSNTTPATMAAAYQNIINTLRSQNPLIDIVIGVPQFTQNETEQPKTYSNRDYAIAAFEVAQANRCAFVDFAQIFGAFSQAQIDAGFMSSDRTHPQKPRGGAVMADNIYRLLKK